MTIYIKKVLPNNPSTTTIRRPVSGGLTVFANPLSRGGRHYYLVCSDLQE
jgi:hypothetical protein